MGNTPSPLESLKSHVFSGRPIILLSLEKISQGGSSDPTTTIISFTDQGQDTLSIDETGIIFMPTRQIVKDLIYLS